MAYEPTITNTENGPISVKGPFKLVDTDGNPHDMNGRKRIALGRCGASATKPFCDGTHSRIGFEAAARVVPEGRNQERGDGGGRSTLASPRASSSSAN